MTAVWRWFSRELVILAHDEQLVEHGGAAGLRDAGLLDSALARPQQLAAYGDPDVFDLAAAYAFGIARNHPFVDGNKRTHSKTGSQADGHPGRQSVHQRSCPMHRPRRAQNENDWQPRLGNTVLSHKNHTL